MSDRRLAPASRPPNFLAGPANQLRLTGHAALAVMLFGTSLLLVSLAGRSDWLVRLPNVVSANVTALSIALLGARWFGVRIGMLAGMIQFTVCCTLQIARLAVADSHLVAAVTVAMCSFAAANLDSPRGRSHARWLPWIFSLAAGLSFRITGPLGPGTIFLGCGLFLLINQDLRAVRFFVNPVGLGLFTLCIAADPQFAAWVSLGVTHSASSPASLNEWLWQIPLAMLPWFPLLPLYLWRRRGQGLLVEPLWRFVICWLLAGLAGLCLIDVSTQSLATLLPGLSVLLAVALVDSLQRRQRGQRLHYGWSCLAVGAAIGAMNLMQFPAAGAMGWLLTGLTACLLFMAWLESRRLLAAHLATLMATCWLLIAGTMLYVAPHHNKHLDDSAGAVHQSGSVHVGRQRGGQPMRIAGS